MCAEQRYLRRGLAGPVLVLAALSLAACGTAVSSRQSGTSPLASPRAPSPQGGATPAPPAASSPALAVALDHLDRLVVIRSDAFPQNHVSFGFPARVTVTDAAEVQAVARALLALPVMPSGAFAVPIDLGIGYRLLFATAGRRLPAVSVAATGAQQVRGLGTTRWLARSPGFWRTLGSAMGLPRPDNATFRGSMPRAQGR